MTDPDSASPAEESLREEGTVVPPAGSSGPGLDQVPSLDAELQAEEQRVQEGEEEAEIIKPKPPLINLRRDTTGRGHRRIGGQTLRTHPMCPSAAAASPISGTSVSGKRTLLMSNEARREMAKQVKVMKEERRAALDARHKYLMSRLVDAGTLGELEVEDALLSDDKFGLIEDFFVANGSKKLMFFHQSVKQNPSCYSSSLDVAPSAGSQRKLFLTTGSSEVTGQNSVCSM